MTVTQELQTQIGSQPLWDTPVVATARLMGIDTIKITPDIDVMSFMHQHSSLQPSEITAIRGVKGGANIGGLVLYEDFQYWLEGLFGIATPSGAGPYVRTGQGPGATQPTQRHFTLSHGVDSDAYRLEAGTLTTLGLTVEEGQEAKWSGALVGKKVSVATMAALSDRTATPVMADHVAIFLDPWSGTIGATALALTAYKIEINWDADILLRRYLGSLTPAGEEVRGYKAEANSLKMTLEFNATSQVLADLMIDPGSSVFQRQVRLEFTNGTNILQLDFAGSQQGAPEAFQDKDGSVSIDLELMGTYNPTLGTFFQYSTTNDVAIML